jgi:phage shock protein C
MKKLRRKKSEQMLAGVCAGVAEYFDLDVSIVRLGWIIFACAAGSGVLAYIIAAIVIPAEY